MPLFKEPTILATRKPQNSVHTYKMSISTQINLCIVTLFFLTFPFCGESQTSSINPEISILLDLKKHFSNPPNISHWTSSSDHCTWPEITCQSGVVTGVQLSWLLINDTIPPFICDLKNLTLLDLNHNYFPGSFPTVLYNCSKLEYLDLSYNFFNGIIPDDISRLSPWLQAFNLSSNWFIGGIPAGIGGLKGLKELQLAAAVMNGSIPSEIGNLLDLEVLVLNQNPFSPQEIPSSFTQLKKLRNLWIKEANLIGEIPENISTMAALEYLDLSMNGLTGSIPSDLFLLKNLSKVYLYGNRLSGPIPQPVEALNLIEVDFSDNSLTGSIPEDFGQLIKLEILSLFTNGLTGNIPNSLFLLKNLTRVLLDGNRLSGPIPQPVEALNLNIVDFSNNSLTGSIPEDFGQLMKLEGMYLYMNQLSGEIPAGIGRLPALSYIELDTNNLSGKVPPDFGKFSKLRLFGVSKNHLTGSLPDSLCDNKELYSVVAYDNYLTGELPKSLEDCDTLSGLRVEKNHLTSHLPQKVAPNLILFDISNNQISGEIPLTISSWSNLKTFRASNNLLTGKIPEELTALKSLSDLALDGNKLSGNFPSNNISWKSLSTLVCSRNQLSGTIPPALGLLPNLGLLDLSENQFSGEIPPELGHLVPTSLNLSSNHLSGKIPDELEVAGFEYSFLNNPDLCATKPLLDLGYCGAKTEKSYKVIAILGSIAAFSFLMAILYMLYACISKKKRKQEVVQDWKLTPFHSLSFTESDILSNLEEKNVVGSGGSGKVYVVPLSCSTAEKVAVKRIWNNHRLDEELEKQFVAEVQILGTIRHSNIVKLLCCISSKESKLLVYEYMENRSLDLWLHAKRRSLGQSQVLDWPTRLNIAIGAALGLSYMHHNCLPPIIHRDVKSSNVLLDSEFYAKIADFGLARVLIKRNDPNTVSAVAGSFGYIAPECAYTSKVNEKIDVYSFGVILLELVTGREPNDGDEDWCLADWALYHVQEGKPIVDALDANIKETQYWDEMCGVFRLGIICTGENPAKRPTMREALQILREGRLS